MAYLVNITFRAERDLTNLYVTIHAEHSAMALRWYHDLKQAILTLEEYPKRCPVTPENKKCRHLLYGHKSHVYRVIYRIIEKKKRVDVLHIRYGARQTFKKGDLM